MFSANQIAGFFNQPYLQNKSIKWPEFLQVDQKIFGWTSSKMGMASLVTRL